MVETALAAAGARGTEVVAILDEVSSAHVRWARNAFTTNGIADDRRLTVVALGAGRPPGVATVSGALTGEAVTAIVAAADAARGRGDEPEPPPPVTTDEGDGWARPPAAPAAGGLPTFAARLAASFRSAAAASHSLHGYAEQRTRTTYVASSAGLRRRHEESSALLDHTVRSTDGTASTWTGTTARELSQLDLDAAYDGARRRLGWWRRRVALPTGEYEVLLTPSCVADLMLRLYKAADARATLDGRTVFAADGGGTRAGERLAPAPLTLHSDPRKPGLECAPFTVARGTGAASVYDNGLPLTRTGWIDRGVLSTLVGGRQVAAGGVPAAPEIGNLVLSAEGGGVGTLDELVARTARGLLVTSLWYLREVDPRSLLLTGLTRDGVYLVEDGEVRAATNPFRFNASPLDVLARVREAGRTEPTLPREHDESTPRTAMPPLRVAGFAMSAVSDAV
ncbi:metallopeptidase TldD-related protein [Phytohabitans houttuyneae]|uniref:Peptidase n=1 Tax=Phytohabitans houttuyneae TaxID=1076126 RepID=A0A6V8JZR1_9ACTN|nr:metallopeptidase TldD-related protein [Phytohabitans houttuyneae]GFJ76794.1 peptidase [Phytohabitans houttuyneae]